MWSRQRPAFKPEAVAVDVMIEMEPPRATDPGRPLALVVDGEELSATFLAGLLGRSGLEIETAASGALALGRLAERFFPLIVAGRLLPDMTELDLLAGVRERSPRSRVVIVTASGSIAAALAALSAGAADYVLKPVDDTGAFLCRVRAALDRPAPGPGGLEGVVLESLSGAAAEALAELRDRLGRRPCDEAAS